MTRIFVLLTLLCTMVGCDADTPTADTEKAKPKTTKKVVGEKPLKPTKEVRVGKNVYVQFFEDGNRRVAVNSYVCRRTDFLEQLLCRKLTKEHEAVLAADVDAKTIHAALLVAKAEPGSPVVYEPYKAAHGTKIEVSLQYKHKGKVVVVPAQSWVKNLKTKKTMKYKYWVFAGSRIFKAQREGEKPFYAANDGDIICVANFDTALLDLPVRLPKDNSELVFEANTEVIPPEKTPVRVILQPILEKNTKKVEKKNNK
ncbi:MAG: YdjY domain-containing protein [Gemmataceae bacterium]